MPILDRDNFGNDNPNPLPRRGIEFRKYLAPSVKIGVNGASGSGTIIHYDVLTKLAYVATCGHLWQQGIMNVDEGKKRNRFSTFRWGGKGYCSYRCFKSIK
jgi:hypothetical protein